MGSSSAPAVIAAAPVAEDVKSTEPARTGMNKSAIAVSQKAEHDVRKIKKSFFVAVEIRFMDEIFVPLENKHAVAVEKLDIFPGCVAVSRKHLQKYHLSYARPA